MKEDPPERHRFCCVTSGQSLTLSEWQFFSPIDWSQSDTANYNGQAEKANEGSELGHPGYLGHMYLI